MNHAEHDETIGSMLANIAAALREVSEKLDVVAARVAQEVPGFPGDDEDVPDQLRIRRLEAWAFHASQDISRLSARLDALDGGDDPAPPPARGRSRREVREAAERAAAHEEATRPPLERRQSSRSVPDHLGDPTWPITSPPVPRATTEPHSGVVAGERGRAAQHEEGEPRTAAFAVQSPGLGDPEPQAARASNGARGDTAQRPKVNGAHAPEATVREAVPNAQRVNGRLPAQPERETPARGVADDIAAQGVGLAANRAVVLPDSTDDLGRHDAEAAPVSGGFASVERARPVGKVPTETRGTERHTTSGNVTWSPNGVDPQAQRNGSVSHGATDQRPAVEHAGGSEDLRHSSFDAGTAGERVGDPEDAHRAAPASGHVDDQQASSARGPVNGTGVHSSPSEQDRAGIVPTEDAHAAEARVATNGTTFNGFADRSASAPKNGSANGIQWSFDDDVETTLPTPPRNGHARNGFTTDSRGESVFADFTPRNSTTSEKPAAPARLVAPPVADSAHQVEGAGRATVPSEHLEQAPRSGPSVGGPDYRTSPATESVDRSGATALPTDYPNQAGHSAPAAGDPGHTHQPADRITQGEQSRPSDEAANGRYSQGERSSRPHGHSAEETGRTSGQDANTGPLAAQAAHNTARFTNSDNEAGTRHGRPAAPAVDLPAVHTSSSADDNLGPAPIPTATDPAGITVTGTYRAFDLESAAHVDKLQAMLDELKRSAGLPPGRRDVFGPPTQDLG
ncbi:hypothetical protein [Nocardia rosealba]|uniref:hypothetical protein n=1 Tax=Nocardia rosealba TaxID=2878563 RepID=UPI001CD97EF2|nr:hypothetical protein [Nocardia rosealba]MCA2208374.1 hypothetical protein [Nocardia rosealba]